MSIGAVASVTGSAGAPFDRDDVPSVAFAVPRVALPTP